MFDRHAKVAFVIVCIMLVAGKFGLQYTATALNVFLQKKPVELRKNFDTIPHVVSAWKSVGGDRTLSKEMVEALGTDKYLNRLYRSSDRAVRHPLDVHLAYYRGMIDAVPHVADRCLVAAGYEQQSLPANFPLGLDMAGWSLDPERVNRKMDAPYPYVTHKDQFTGTISTVRMPLGEFELRTTEFSHSDAPGSRVFAGYLFIANGCTTAQPERIRLLAFDKTDEYAYYCKVQFMMEGKRDLTREKFLETVSGFMKDFLPELMRCLPDWSEIEALDQRASATGASTANVKR